jgi:cell division protein FtsL
MQVAPKAIGNFPNIPAYPQKKASNPSRRPLPQSKTRTAAAETLCAMLVIAAVMITPAALVNLTVKAVSVENSYRIQRISSQIDTEKAKSEEIKLTNAKMSSLERIKTVAIEKLAMAEPTVEARIISMPGDGVTSPEYASLTTKEAR